MIRDDGTLDVLLVEDNDGDVALAREALCSPGHYPTRISVTPTLARTLDRLKERAFDVCLLDLHLPDSRGIETVIAVRTAAPQMPVVVITGMSDPALKLAVDVGGAQDFLSKENGWSSPAMLFQTIAHAIRRAPAARMAMQALDAEEMRRILTDSAPQCISPAVCTAHQALEGKIDTILGLVQEAKAERHDIYSALDSHGNRIVALETGALSDRRHAVTWTGIVALIVSLLAIVGAALSLSKGAK